MTIACFSVALIDVPSRRAMTSPGPPAEKGTTIVIGRLGNSWPNADSTGESNSISRTHFTNFMATSYRRRGAVKQLVGRKIGHSSAVAFSFDADVRSIMLSAATAAALM